MTKLDLIAVKPMRYATRQLVAGEPFQANRRDGRVLVAIGKAQHAGPASEEVPAADDAANDVGALRDAYQAKFGKRPYMGWDAETLQKKLTEG